MEGENSVTNQVEETAIQSPYATQSALYGTIGGPDAESMAPSYQSSRSFFIIDKSRMVDETDTVEGAKVVYLPESEFKKELYHNRCSYLIGVADVYRNLTGDFPQSLTMSGCCYACKLLQPNYFMFLLGRPFEPVERVLASLQHITDVFHFYYRSPEAIMKRSMGDWETFTTNMTFVFSKIKEFVFRDPHSIPFMFPTLPYVQSGPIQKRSRLFMLASHILRTCQQHEPVIGGCIMYSTETVCSQLSPRLMEKLQVVGGGGIELNTKSILAENVAPETVWVLEVYLTPEEVEDLTDTRKDLRQYQRAYDDMTPNPALIDSTITFTSRFQPGSPMSTSPRRNTKRSSRKPTKLGSWRSHVQTPPVSGEEDYYNYSHIPPMHGNGGEVTSNSVGLDKAAAGDSTIPIPSPRNQRTPREGSSPQVSRASTAVGVGTGGRGRGGGRRSRAGMGQKRRTGINREMPQLHGRGEKRVFHNRPYDYLEEFVNISSPEGVSFTAKQPSTPPEGSPPSPTRSDKLPPFPTTIQASLSIPIEQIDKPLEGQSPLLSVTGSSYEEERFATPSPNFPTLQSSHLQQPPTEDNTASPLPTAELESSSCVDRSNSYQTADDELLDPLWSQKEHKLKSDSVEKHISSVYGTPEAQVTPVLKSSSPHAQHELEESSDFVDTAVLDKLILRSQQEFEKLQVQPRRKVAGAQVQQSGSLICNAPTSDAHLLPPQLPPRNQTSINDTEINISDIVGSSGEFTVVGLSPPIPPRPSSQGKKRTGRGSGKEEYTPPPSPPPRIQSQRKTWESPQCLPLDTSSHVLPKDDGVPPTPPPREKGEHTSATECLTVAMGDLPKRSESSSPDYQHRVLTQRVTQSGVSSGEDSVEGEGERGGGEEDEEGEREREGREDGEGKIPGGGKDEEGERDKVQGQRVSLLHEEKGGVIEAEGSRETVTMGEDGSLTEMAVDPVQEKRSSTCVDPPEEGEEISQSTFPEGDVATIVQTLTSDEEEDESGDVRIATNVKPSTLRYNHHPLSASTPSDRNTARMGLHMEDNSSLSSSLSILRLPGTPSSGASLSLYQLNTPETTLVGKDLQTARADVGNGNGTRSRMADVDSDMAQMRQTLSRQLQPPTVQPAPPLETWCIYVQRQFNTVVILAAKAGLQNDHSLLTQIWKSLLPQLFALDQGLESLEEHKSHKGLYNLAVYQNTDKFCAVESQRALYKFRHAVRFTHLEYEKDPDLCQVSLLNAPKMVSQRVMGRETYYHFQKGMLPDVFSAVAGVTKTVKQTTHQPLSGDTPARFL